MENRRAGNTNTTLTRLLRTAVILACASCCPSTHAGPPNNTILGAYVGNDPVAVTQMETWLGRPLDAVLGYVGAANWTDWNGSLGWMMNTLWADVKINHMILWSIPLIPNGATLDSASRGLYNHHYRAAANTLKNFRPQDSVLYIRTAWEFNGDWFADNAVGHTTEWIAAWRHFVTIFDSTSTRFRFDWCTNFGITKMAPDLAYPGDDYVDIIGMDFYDETIYGHITDPVERWDHKMNEPYGFKWHRDFAALHGKRMSYAEWGVGGNSAGDAPYIVEQMYNWIRDNPVVYQTIWNSNAAYSGKLSDGQYPNAAAKYKELFGVTTAVNAHRNGEGLPRFNDHSSTRTITGTTPHVFDIAGRRLVARDLNCNAMRLFPVR